MAMWWKGGIRAAAAALILSVAACGPGSGPTPASTASPPAASVSTAPSGASPAVESAAPLRRPDEVLAANIELAHSACKGCGGELNADAAAKKKMIGQLVREHSQHKDFVLSAANAELALYGPVGSKPRLAGANNPPPDVSFKGAGDTEVYRREVKTFAGTPTTFARQFEDYAKKLGYRGELFVQVRPGTDVRALMEAFWNKNRDELRLARYADVYVAFHEPAGRPVGLWMLGARGMGVPG